MASIRAAQANTWLLLATRRPDNQFTVFWYIQNRLPSR